MKLDSVSQIGISRQFIAATTTFVALAVVLLAAGCGAESGEIVEETAAPTATVSETSPAIDGGAASLFSATMSGAIDGSVKGDGGIAGAKFGRYHVNLSSRPEGDEPRVVIAFARKNTEPPATGTFPLGGRGDDDFGGTVEIYGDPERTFVIKSGELTINHATSDVLHGEFTLTAVEMPEEYTPTPAELQVQGTFESTVR